LEVNVSKKKTKGKRSGLETTPKHQRDIAATSEMAKEITEDEVRKDEMVFANILFERGMTDDPLGVVDAWRSGALVAVPAANGGLYWKAGDHQLEP
jgi:hypothetical protein